MGFDLLQLPNTMQAAHSGNRSQDHKTRIWRLPQDDEDHKTRGQLLHCDRCAQHLQGLERGGAAQDHEAEARY